MDLDEFPSGLVGVSGEYFAAAGHENSKLITLTRGSANARMRFIVVRMVTVRDGATV